MDVPSLNGHDTRSSSSLLELQLANWARLCCSSNFCAPGNTNNVAPGRLSNMFITKNVVILVFDL